MYQKVKPKKNNNKPKPSPVTISQSSKKIKFSKKTNWKIIISIFIIALITFISFYPSLNNDFTNWDDPVYVTENSLITNLDYDNIKQLFSKPVSLNYHPLTIVSLAIDYKTGYDKNTKIVSARPFHATNLILHIFNTILVFFLIYLLSGNNLSIALIVSLFFGIHPLRVESVSWISERKDVLYCFFYISALITYIKYIKTNKLFLYFFVILLFVFSLLSKGMAISLPFILITIDYYLNRKFTKKLIIEKLPFIILSVLFGIIAIKIQSKGAISEFEIFNIYERISIASYGFFMYIYKLFFPFNLCSYYPYPFPFIKELMKLPVLFYLCPVFIALLGTIIYFSKKYTKLLIFGMLFYFFSIAMVLQFISVGTVIIADRYTYIPYIGLFFIIAVFYKYLSDRSIETKNQKYKIFKNLKYVFIIILFIYTIICSYTTYNRTIIWQNSETLWTDVINKYPMQVETSYMNRGNYYARELSLKDSVYLDKAMDDYKVLIDMKSKNPQVYSNLGNIYVMKGKLEKSIECYNIALLFDSSDYKTLINRALTYIKLKKYALSLKDIEKAIKISPTLQQPHTLEAFNYIMLNDFEKAIILYSKLIADYPDFYDSYYYRGVAYYNLQQYDNSLNDFNYYLKLFPNNNQIYFNISNIYVKKSEYSKAYQFALKAKELGYNVDSKYLDQLNKKAVNLKM